MKSTDERMEMVFERARERERMARRRKSRVVALSGGVLSVVAIVLVGIGVSMAVRSSGSSPDGSGLDLMGSVFAGGSAFGYVAVGLTGIVLGVAVTVIVFRFGKGAGSYGERAGRGIGAQDLSDDGSFAAQPPARESRSKNSYDSATRASRIGERDGREHSS